MHTKEIGSEFNRVTTRNHRVADHVDSSITITEEMRKLRTIVVSDSPTHILRRNREVAMEEIKIILNPPETKLSHKERRKVLITMTKTNHLYYIKRDLNHTLDKHIITNYSLVDRHLIIDEYHLVNDLLSKSQEYVIEDIDAVHQWMSPLCDHCMHTQGRNLFQFYDFPELMHLPNPLMHILIKGNNMKMMFLLIQDHPNVMIVYTLAYAFNKWGLIPIKYYVALGDLNLNDISKYKDITDTYFAMPENKGVVAVRFIPFAFSSDHFKNKEFLSQSVPMVTRVLSELYASILYINGHNYLISKIVLEKDAPINIKTTKEPIGIVHKNCIIQGDTAPLRIKYKKKSVYKGIMPQHKVRGYPHYKTGKWVEGYTRGNPDMGIIVIDAYNVKTKIRKEGE